MIIVIMPLGVPGMGKTTFINQSLTEVLGQLSAEFTLRTISSDKIKNELMSDYLSRNPSKTQEQAHEASGKKANGIFNHQINESLSNAVGHSTIDYHVIALDKNYLPEHIGKTVDTIDKIYSELRAKDTQLLKVGLIPDILSPAKDMPFSLHFVVECYLRALRRKDHEYLVNPDPDFLARLIFMFYKAFFKQSFDDKFLRLTQLDGFFKVPLTYEHADFELPHNLQTSIEKCLQHTSAKFPDSHPVFERFVHLVDLYTNFFTSDPADDKGLEQSHILVRQNLS
jgi:hypothetical protein